ncbi:MAG: hypothetical protein Q7T44_11110 [Parvibaculum sp.]|nr:hypothetical protein [Parvibaculum sp.]
MRFRRGCFVALGASVLCASVFLFASPSVASGKATLAAGEQVIKVGETAQFAITSSADTSEDLNAWCEVTTSGRASLTFDGDHYIPLSEPSVGDVVSFAPNETRRYELVGSVEANRGDAYVAFAFTGVPSAMCFPGQQCDGAAAGAQDVKVVCANN